MLTEMITLFKLLRRDTATGGRELAFSFAVRPILKLGCGRFWSETELAAVNWTEEGSHTDYLVMKMRNNVVTE